MNALALSWEAFARRPAVVTAILAILGVGLHRILPDGLETWVILSVGLLLAGILFHRREHLACALLAASIFTTLVALAQMRSFYFRSDHIAVYTTDHPRLARIRAAIASPPKLLNPTGDAPHRRSSQQVFQARVLSVRTLDGWTDASGTLGITVDLSSAPTDRAPPVMLKVGQTIQALGMLGRPRVPMNPGQFDFASYSRGRGVLGTLRIESMDNISVLSDTKSSILWSVRQKARDALARGFTDAQALDHALLGALFLGDRDPIIRDVQDLFIMTGTSHHLAISGMHVAVLGAFIYGLCRLLRLRPRRSAWIGMGFVLLYAMVTVPSPPVIRSVLLCLAFAAGLIARRSVDAVQLLSLTVVGMLIYSPLDLFEPGFQLSFGCVLGLILFTPSIHGLMIRRSTDPLTIIAPSHPAGIARRVVRTLGRHGRGALSAGLAAWLVSVPLVAWHFDRFNPWAVLSGIVLGVPVFLGLIGGLLKVVLTLAVPWGAAWWAMVAQVPMILMRSMAQWLSYLPSSDLPMGSSPLWLIVFYYGLLFMMIVPLEPLRRWVRWNPAGLAVVVLAVPLLGGCWPTAQQPMHLSILSVGAGNCAVAELPDGQTVVFDAGSATFHDPYRSVIGPFLRSRGIRSIDTLYLSHANTDHYNAVPALLKSGIVQRIVLPQGFEDSCGQSAAGRQLLATMRSSGAPVDHLQRGQTITHGSATVHAIWPDAGLSLGANDSSLVVRLTCNGRSILFPGDIESPAQSRLVAHPDDLRCDILLAPHHGSTESTTDSFMVASNAKLIVSSNDSTLAGKQRTLERIVKPGRLLRTHAAGAITFRVNADQTVDVQTFIQQKTPDQSRYVPAWDRGSSDRSRR